MLLFHKYSSLLHISHKYSLTTIVLLVVQHILKPLVSKTYLRNRNMSLRGDNNLHNMYVWLHLYQTKEILNSRRRKAKRTHSIEDDKTYLISLDLPVDSMSFNKTLFFYVYSIFLIKVFERFYNNDVCNLTCFNHHWWRHFENYWMWKKFCSFLFSNYIVKSGQDFVDSL